MGRDADAVGRLFHQSQPHLQSGVGAARLAENPDAVVVDDDDQCVGRLATQQPGYSEPAVAWLSDDVGAEQQFRCEGHSCQNEAREREESDESQA